MVETSYYWEGLVTGDATLAPYTPALFHSIWQVMLSRRDNQGVLDAFEDELLVSGISGGVSVATGIALVEGTFYRNTSPVTVTILSPVTDPRIDRIVLRKNPTARTVRIFRLEGTEDPAPVAPGLTQIAGATWEIPLAQALITVGGDITVTDEREITNTRLEPHSAIDRIETQTLSTPETTITFSSIPAFFDHLWLVLKGRMTNMAVNPWETVGLRFNGDTGATYAFQYLEGLSTTATQAVADAVANSILLGSLPDNLSQANFASDLRITIPNYRLTTHFKTVLSHSSMMSNASSFSGIYAGLWKDTNAISSLTLLNHFFPAGTFLAGTEATLYGLEA